MTKTARAGNPAHDRREDAIGPPPRRPTLVPAERYYSAEFARLEAQRLWPRVWQVACSVDHVAEPGDYFEYRCGTLSVLIVRSDDGTLRAFQNVCRLVMMLWMRTPPGAPHTKPADVRLNADNAHPGVVLTQDITVLSGLQRGLHQPGLTHVVLSNEERRVINMHRNLDRYLELPESERVAGGEPVDTSTQRQW